MTGTLPLLRTRLELDRALRQRPFFARTLAGRLSRREYLDLLFQLAALADGVDPTQQMREVVRADGAALGQVPPTAVCAAARMLARAARGGELGPAAGDVALAVLGSPWADEACARLEERYPEATGLLAALGARGAQALARLEAALDDERRDPRAIYGFAELVRGAFLGLAAHLETTWPAPVASFAPLRAPGGLQ
ncbi:MAG: hypothetical protein M9894_15615 [Planctomycetes bacterium]|nr:hypothetical protein [Planctomycetota bacterium]